MLQPTADAREIKPMKTVTGKRDARSHMPNFNGRRGSNLYPCPGSKPIAGLALFPSQRDPGSLGR